MIEKRIFQRLEVSNDVKVTSFDSNKHEKNLGLLNNFSDDGLCVSFEKTPNIKLNDDISIRLNLNNIPLKINSRLKWINNDSRKMGFEFLSDEHSSFKNTIRNFYNTIQTGFFLVEVTAYLKDINLYGTGYFSRYFEWQGIAREEYFMTVPNYEELMRSGIKLITKNAWVDYINHCFVFDKITLKIQNDNIKKYSFEMKFLYFNTKTKQIIAKGGQVLVFADHLGKLVPIPKQILQVIEQHKMS